MLTDKHMHVAHRLLKIQFPGVQGAGLLSWGRTTAMRLRRRYYYIFTHLARMYLYVISQFSSANLTPHDQTSRPWLRTRASFADFGAIFLLTLVCVYNNNSDCAINRSEKRLRFCLTLFDLCHVERAPPLRDYVTRHMTALQIPTSVTTWML